MATTVECTAANAARDGDGRPGRAKDLSAAMTAKVPDL
jgi:hypothetical protein